MQNQGRLTTYAVPTNPIVGDVGINVIRPASHTSQGLYPCNSEGP